MEKLNIDVKIFSGYIINFINETNSFNEINDVNKKITHLKLQKMLYFVYVYALTEWDKKLWENKFENWKLGPVVPEIYQEYSKYNDEAIELKNNEIKLPMLTNFEKLELQSLILELNNFTAKELSKKSHASPWKKVKKHEEIRDEDIINHYCKPGTFINKLINEASLETNFKFLS